MQGSKKIPITDLNQHITCKICNGYFVDATTIIECLHTFCRSCIVKYLETNRYCPVCDVQVHKTKPLLNIRPDKTIQDIVYKLVPRLFQNEMQRRREFYEAHPETKPSSLEQCGEASYQHLLTPEETVCLTLTYHGSNNTPRYLRCPAAVSMGHLKKLIRAKYDLAEEHKVEILYNQDCLNSSLTLMDVAYIYFWKRKGPIELTYRIYENTAKKLRLDVDLAEPSQASNNNNNWKEVQLRISENGEMSITGIQEGALSPSLLEIVNSDQKYKNEVVTVVETKPANKNTATPKKELPGLKYIGKCVNALTSTSSSVTAPKKSKSELDSNSVPVSSTATTVQPPETKLETSTSEVVLPIFLTSCATLSSGTTTTVFSTINNTKCSTKSDDATPVVEPAKNEESPPSSKADKETEGGVEKEKDKDSPKDASPKSPAMVNSNSLASASPQTEKTLKRKSEDTSEAEPPVKQPKQTILNHSIGLLNLSNNHPLKKHSKLNRNGETPKEIPVKSNILECNVATTSAALVTTISVTPVVKTSPVATTTDVTFSKPSFINKNFANVQLSRPGTPILTSKPAIMSTKASIIPPKPPTTNYSGSKSPCYMPKTVYNPVITVPKPVTTHTSNVKSEVKYTTVSKNEHKPPVTSTSPSKTATIPPASTTKTEGKTTVVNSAQQQASIANTNSKAGIKSKPSTPIGYKTLRDPPKSWNSQISKANISKPATDPKYADPKNARPAKFFKMRNNMPRYLGNPASGVKPMYQVHVSPDKDKPQEMTKIDKCEIKKHSIVKIDPKTLKPISEQAPETTSLSNYATANAMGLVNCNLTSYVSQALNAGLSVSSAALNSQSDLKINTSSVSIFNPLKLQSSPKNERKSPKSPHSPKLKSQATNSPTGGKRDKVNLNFTPPNPFIPNLTSPTMSPNQFLYPTGPPGFPTYDPRVMAAYHSLWYGQRMPFPTSPIPGLSLDLNPRKNYEMSAPTSPTMGSIMQQRHGAQIPSTKQPATTSSTASSVSRTQNLVLMAQKTPSTSKKSAKDSKNEKSLENAVEKLTQSRNKEISKTDNCVNSEPAEKPSDRAESGKGKGGASEKASDRVGTKAEEKENVDGKVGETTPSGGSASSPEKSKSGDVTVRPAEVKSSVVTGTKPEAVANVGVSKDDVKNSPLVDRDKEEKSGSILVASKSLSCSSNNNKTSEEVVEGAK